MFSNTLSSKALSLSTLTKNLPSNSGEFSTSSFLKRIVCEVGSAEVPKNSISSPNLPSIFIL